MPIKERTNLESLIRKTLIAIPFSYVIVVAVNYGVTYLIMGQGYPEWGKSIFVTSVIVGIVFWIKAVKARKRDKSANM